MNDAARGALSNWTPNHCASLAEVGDRALPLIAAQDAQPLLSGIDLWDMWPLELPDGSTAIIGGQSLCFVLSAPALPDPVERHNHARIRLLRRDAEGWHDLGHALPQGLNPGSREWSGSAVLEADGSVRLYYTVAGLPGALGGYEQRLFETHGRLTSRDGGPSVAGWSEPQEMFASDGRYYHVARQTGGAPGTIKAFRDPAWFRDPADGREYVVFAGSAGWSDDPYNAVIGLGLRDAAGWSLQSPILGAVGVNNELERPHIRHHDGNYYLFWSTQRHTFSPTVRAGPTGLYAMVASALSGPWIPVNGDGLVVCNPLSESRQGYSWIVTGEWEVLSFVDYWGMEGRRPKDDVRLLREHFGGTPAPVFRLEPKGDTVRRVT